MFAPSDLAPTLAPLGEARPLPPRAYLAEDVFHFERDAVFSRAWTCVAREQELSLPGEIVVAPIPGAEVILTRTASLDLRALHNVCSHRGASLLDPGTHRRARLVCPYHGWTYELDGRFRSAPALSEPPLEARPRCSMTSASSAALADLVWACPGEPWSSVDDAFSGLSEELAPFALRRLRLGRRVEHVALANWKLLAENFLESHHFPPVHPELERLTPTHLATTLSPRGAWFGGTMELLTEHETVSEGGRLARRPLLGQPRRLIHDYLLFPACLLSVQPDYLLMYRLWPEAAARTRIVSEIWFHPASEADRTFDPSPVFSFWDRVNAQDRAICERQQRGLASPGFRGGCYVSVEESAHRFASMVARAYLGQCPW